MSGLPPDFHFAISEVNEGESIRVAANQWQRQNNELGIEILS